MRQAQRLLNIGADNNGHKDVLIHDPVSARITVPRKWKQENN
jgi:hypothetical protein